MTKKHACVCVCVYFSACVCVYFCEYTVCVNVLFQVVTGCLLLYLFIFILLWLLFSKIKAKSSRLCQKVNLVQIFRTIWGSVFSCPQSQLWFSNLWQKKKKKHWWFVQLFFCCETSPLRQGRCRYQVCDREYLPLGTQGACCHGHQHRCVCECVSVWPPPQGAGQLLFHAGDYTA